MKTLENAVIQQNNQLMVVKKAGLLLNPNIYKAANKTASILSKAILACAVLTILNAIV